MSPFTRKAMVTRHSLQVVDDHLLFEVEGRTVLVDTGAPTSFGMGPVTLLGTVHPLADSYMGLSAAKLEEYLGTRVDVVLGADLLRTCHVRIDRNGGELVFSAEAPEGKGTEIPARSFMGIPIVDLRIGGESLPAFVDTGAKLSYVPAAVAERLSPIGTAEDFYPLIGAFSTDLYETRASLPGALPLSLRVGVLPDLLQMSLMLGGVQAILGSDLFRSYVVTFSPSGSLFVEPSS